MLWIDWDGDIHHWFRSKQTSLYDNVILVYSNMMLNWAMGDTLLQIWPYILTVLQAVFVGVFAIFCVWRALSLTAHCQLNASCNWGISSFELTMVWGSWYEISGDTMLTTKGYKKCFTQTCFEILSSLTETFSTCRTCRNRVLHVKPTRQFPGTHLQVCRWVFEYLCSSRILRKLMFWE